MNVILIKLIGTAVIPGLIGFGWIFIWKDVNDPFKFHLYWNISSQLFILYLVVSQITVAWGVSIWSAIMVSFILIFLYLSDLAGTPKGFILTGLLILINVVLHFIIIISSFSHLDFLFLINPNFGPNILLKSFINEVSLMGVLLTASSQLYWHEKLKENQERRFTEQIFDSLNLSE